MKKKSPSIVLKKNVEIGRMSFHDLTNGLDGLKKLIKKGKFINIRFDFTTRRNWSEADEIIIRFIGDRPEAKSERAIREDEPYRNMKYFEMKYEEAKAVYLKQEKKK